MVARVALVLCMVSSVAGASEPIKKTVTGCVVGGAFFSWDGKSAYRFTIDLDFTPFEGKRIAMKGSLLPGDRFILDDGTKPEVKADKCPVEALRPIKRIEAIDLRLAAGRAAKAGDFDKAIELSNQAIAVIVPAECDSHVDRATVLAQQGDLDGARADLALIKAKKKCYVDKTQKMNYLLLEDLAKEFVGKGDKQSAVTALELALASCDSELCRPDIKKALAEARKRERKSK